MSYRKGVNAENQLISFLKDRGYDTVHSSGNRGPVDVIASKKIFFGLSSEKFAIQVKATTSEVLTVPKEELVQLMKSADQHDSYAVLAVRFSNDRWRFWTDEEELLSSYDKTAMKHLVTGKSVSAELSIDDKLGQQFEQVF